MGTRASFWIGNPVDLENREWLGCIAWDGHPDNFEELANVTTRDEFHRWIDVLKCREDFAHPQGGWPFPWDGNIFLTDVTYAFFDDTVNVCAFYSEFVSLRGLLNSEVEFPDSDDQDHIDVPAPSKYNSAQPDSIHILTIRGR